MATPTRELSKQMLLFNVVAALTQAEINSCSANCNTLTGTENLDCRSKCAQVPFGDSTVVDNTAACQKKCGSDQTCYNQCNAQFVSQSATNNSSTNSSTINPYASSGYVADSTWYSVIYGAVQLF